MLAGEHQTFLDKFNANSAFGEVLYDLSQIIQITRQPIHAMYHYCVAIAHKRQELRKCWTLGVFARCLIGKDPIDQNLIKLPIRMLAIIIYDDEMARLVI